MQARINKTMPVWQGVLILSMATLFAKVLSAAYRIPYQNMSGDIGFYVYQQIYPFYGIVMMLAMYGFPVVLSKHRAELLANGKNDEARQLTSLLFYGLFILATATWGVMYGFADAIASIMGDEQLAAPIRSMSYILFLLPFLSIGRGYHQGNGELVPTAVSHVSEQFVRVTLILGFTYLFVTSGLDAYQIGTGAAYGSLLGGLSGIIVLLMMTKGAWMKELIDPRQLTITTLLRQNIELFKQSGFICLSALVFVLFQLLDAFSVIRLLQWHGLDAIEAFTVKGVYDRGQPLLQLGTVLTTTLSLALVPMLAKAVAEQNRKQAEYYQHLSYRLTFVVGGAATIGLMVIIEPTNHMLFTDAIGSGVLRVMALAIVFSSFFVTLAAILQGYQLAHFPARAVGLGLLIKGAGNLLLIPLYGTIGAAWSTVVALALMVVYLLVALHQKQQLFFGEYRTYSLILALLFVMGAVTWLWRVGIMYNVKEPSRGADTIVALTSAGVGALVVVGCLLILPIFSEEEWETIPKLRRIRMMMKRRG